jgi:hypothetical protein
MNFRFGPQSAAAFSALVFTLAFGFRLMLGDHTIFQAGTEGGFVAAFCFATYCAGYKAPLWAWKSDLGLLVGSVASGIALYCTGHFLSQGVLFDSRFVLILYGLSAAIMYGVGYSDRWFESGTDD